MKSFILMLLVVMPAWANVTCKIDDQNVKLNFVAGDDVSGELLITEYASSLTIPAIQLDKKNVRQSWVVDDTANFFVSAGGKIDTDDYAADLTITTKKGYGTYKLLVNVSNVLSYAILGGPISNEVSGKVICN